MAREAKSHVRKRRRGCISGCLTNILLLLGLAALLFVGACVLGFVKNDPETGAPSLSLDGVAGLSNLRLPDISLPENLPDVTLPSWAYGVSKTGLTVKTLRAGDGEAVLVCADGYTMLLGGGSGMGVMLTGQLLLCGVSHLNAAVAMSSQQSQIGGLPLAITLMPPQYLLFQDSQTKGAAYNRMMAQAQKKGGIQAIVPQQGLSFMLGRARVTFIGPARTVHTDERDDALICALGGSEEATCTEFVSAVSPSIALMTGKSPANAVKVRLTRVGAQVYTAKEHGVMTLVSDGQTIQIKE